MFVAGKSLQVVSKLVAVSDGTNHCMRCHSAGLVSDCPEWINVIDFLGLTRGKQGEVQYLSMPC